jgi:hypothetical protein
MTQPGDAHDVQSVDLAAIDQALLARGAELAGCRAGRTDPLSRLIPIPPERH